MKYSLYFVHQKQKQYKDGVLFIAEPNLEINGIYVGIRIFERLIISPSKNKRNQRLTMDGYTYNFVRTYSDDNPQFVEEEQKEIIVLPSRTFDLEEGKLAIMEHPVLLKKAARTKFEYYDNIGKYLLPKSNKFAISRKIEEILWDIGLSELEVLEIKPEILQCLGINEWQRYAHTMLSFEEQFARALKHAQFIS